MKCCPRFGAGTVSCKKRKERRRDILLQFCLHCWIRWPFQCEADITSPVYTTVVPRTDLLVYVGRGQELLLNVGVRLKQWVHFSVGTVIRSDDEKFLLQLPRRGRKCVHISARALHGSEWITKKNLGLLTSNESAQNWFFSTVISVIVRVIPWSAARTKKEKVGKGVVHTLCLTQFSVTGHEKGFSKEWFVLSVAKL